MATIIRITAGFILLVFSAFTITGHQWRVLSAHEMAEACGGADCYVDGTTNCPEASDYCLETNCTLDEETGDLTCPSDATGEESTGNEYVNISKTEGPGKKGTNDLESIDCTNILSCSGCDIDSDCEDGAVSGQTDPRTPTEVDPDSESCNEE